MTNYREILRLHSLGLNKTEIASSCQCARNTVAATLQRAANCGLQWPLPEVSGKGIRFSSYARLPFPIGTPSYAEGRILVLIQLRLDQQQRPMFH